MFGIPRLSLLFFIVQLVLSTEGSLFAQPLKPTKFKAGADRKFDTRVTVELVTSQGAGLAAQEWNEIFQDLNVSLSIRRSVLNDKPETREATLGVNLREVTVLGILDDDGSVTFADRRFVPADVRKLKEWIDGLKAYGAQGSPLGQPLWGLSKTQFEPLFETLSNPLKTEIQGQNLGQAIKSFSIQDRYLITFGADAIQHLENAKPVEQVRGMYAGMSQGTALAAMLNEYDFGIQPRRTANGKVDLVIVRLQRNVETWPVGWPPISDPPKLAPNLFDLADVELKDEPFLDVIDAVADLISIPVVIDSHGMKQNKIDLGKKTVSHKKRRVTWSSALKHVCFQARCKFEVRVDESGHPLLWVMPDVPAPDDK